MRRSAGDAPLLGTTISHLLQLALTKEEEEKEKAKKVKRTLRRFSGRVFILPDAQGRCGFIESDEAKVALALEQDFPFSAGSFGLSDHVTFAVLPGRTGLEAVDLEAR